MPAGAGVIDEHLATPVHGVDWWRLALQPIPLMVAVSLLVLTTGRLFWPHGHIMPKIVRCRVRVPPLTFTSCGTT